MRKIDKKSVEHYISLYNKCKRYEKYQIQEDCLNKLFLETYHTNIDLSEVLIKVACLNDFYSTRIRLTHIVAEKIANCDFDNAIENKDRSIVSKIAIIKKQRSEDFYILLQQSIVSDMTTVPFQFTILLLLSY